MLVTESKSVAERTHFDAAPTSSYFDWAMQALLSVQEPNLKRGLPALGGSLRPYPAARPRLPKHEPGLAAAKMKEGIIVQQHFAR